MGSNVRQKKKKKTSENYNAVPAQWIFMRFSARLIEIMFRVVVNEAK